MGEVKPVDLKRTLSLWEVRTTQEERLVAVAQTLTYSQPRHRLLDTNIIAIENKHRMIYRSPHEISSRFHPKQQNSGHPKP